jgi:tRNA threonylcarbamoyladenosine biosynthesis protein TsaE
MNLPAEIALPDEAATARLGAALAAVLRDGEAICLEGPLGAGKSTLARALVQALTTADEDVPSPTFTIVQFYETAAFPLAHFDLYRLSSPDEAVEIGLDEALDEGRGADRMAGPAGGATAPRPTRYRDQSGRRGRNAPGAADPSRRMEGTDA